mmetsp:Transcript_28260/g.58387  ORF Transcript_28260/g.58387 Transcript_28260/m.58387 type:complete len:346 (-) Transcript_28260:63-1100(-)
MSAPRSKRNSRGGRTTKKKSTGLRATRRRLSVVSDNKLIEGISSIGQNGAATKVEEDESKSNHVVRCFWGSSKKGYAPYNPRKRNQDSILMKEHKSTGTLMLCVLDGHGEAGDLVSHFITDHLARKTFAHKSFKTDPGLAMRDEVLKLEQALLKDASIDTEFSGTTAVLSCIRGRTLHVANIGDSRIILGRQTKKGGMKAVEVSLDHKPDREDEQKRIVAKGGRVFAVEYDDGETGPPRVWLGHLDIPGLAMSRSLGDSVAHTAGVISEPEMFKTTLTEDDKIMVIASDGLWEFMTNQEVIDMIMSTKMAEPRKVVDMLVTEASSRWMKEEQVIDDTTVIVAYLR